MSTLVVALLFSQSYATLVELDAQEMMAYTGQGAAHLNWTLSLNHAYANNLELTDISRVVNGETAEAYYNYVCSNDTLCRFALAANNHVDAAGNKKWLVFKEFQGTLQIDKFTLEGVTIKNQHNKPQTALQIRFEDENPLKIRNLGFASLAVETGAGGKEGYENTPRYDTFKLMRNGQEETVSVPGFDKGQEQGFMGLNIHGNLHMDGALQIFSFNCTGAAGSRC